MQHQISNATKYDRYPVIFKECADYFKNSNPKILSFGCSDGREVKTLRDLYFTESIIHGVDISEKMIDACKKLNLDEHITFYSSENFIPSEYDLIFCMSVLCRWPQTEHLLDCSNEYSFNQFEKQLIELDKMVKPGGLLVIYNANFLFTDTELSKKYTPLRSKLSESGFVKKFNKNNKALNSVYKHSIFIKNA